MRSVSRHTSGAGVLAVCGLLLIGALSGCTTTQEKAVRQQAQAKRILKANEQKHDRQVRQQKSKSHQR